MNAADEILSNFFFFFLGGGGGGGGKIRLQLAVIHLQFWAYGSRDLLFPISMSPTAYL